MRTNEEWYKIDLATDSEEYNITINDFKEWLEAKNMTNTFYEMLNDSNYNDYDIAVDFSIFIIMVKWFRKEAKRA